MVDDKEGGERKGGGGGGGGRTRDSPRQLCIFMWIYSVCVYALICSPLTEIKKVKKKRHLTKFSLGSPEIRGFTLVRGRKNSQQRWAPPSRENGEHSFINFELVKLKWLSGLLSRVGA